jgi:glycosyltransferase involved in cell wall biosynthesis
MSLLIHAPNVHQGGGRGLLLALLDAARRRSDISAILDARLRADVLAELRIVRTVAPGLGSRLAAEWLLRSVVGAHDTVLCFGNLPPLFSVRGRVVLFLQNRYLVRPRSTRGLPVRVRLRNAIERIWLRSRLGAVHTVIVQTPSMAREVSEVFGITPRTAPFAAAADHSDTMAQPQAVSSGPASFLYVASGEPHKNHLNLLAAWRLLFDEGVTASLTLTVPCDRFPALCAAIEDARRHGSMVENVGFVDSATLAGLYTRCSAIVYPSRFESFGLPLIEAQRRGIPILAAELDYVRDLMDPVQSFDPESPVSIARAVKRFLARTETRAELLTPDRFLASVIDKSAAGTT